MLVSNIQVKSGHLIITYEDGSSRSIPAIELLGGTYSPATPTVTTPDLTISSLTLLTKLAQVVMVLVKTLVEQGTLDEELVSDFDLQYVLDTLVDDLAAEDV